ncbi:MAG: caspase family protein [Microcoleaceae cyanobacterium]
MSQQFSHGYALLIGVGESAYPRLSLPVTVKDTQAIYAALIDPNLCSYSEDKIRVLNNKEATKSKILESLNWLQESAKADPQATIFIYFSGHGWLNTADNRYYLLQHDIKPTKLAASALSAEVFTENLRHISAERLFVVIDSCYAAGMATSKDPEEIIQEMEQEAIDLADEFDQFKQIAPSKGLIEQLKQGKGRVVFTSSSGEEKSWFYENELSIYTNHFLEALQGAANQPGDTEVRVSNLMNYLGKAVPETVQKLYKKSQHPNFDMAAEDFVIAKLLGGKGLPDKGWEAVQPEVTQKINKIADNIEQHGKFIININEARDMHIGDVIQE